MSVILQLEDRVWSQGFTVTGGAMDFTNSGDENVKLIRLKVTDSVVFDKLETRYLSAAYNCLNVFSAYYIHGTSFLLPANTTKSILLNVEVKAAAPIQVHSLQCDYQYEVY